MSRGLKSQSVIIVIDNIIVMNNQINCILRFKAIIVVFNITEGIYFYSINSSTDMNLIIMKVIQS